MFDIFVLYFASRIVEWSQKKLKLFFLSIILMYTAWNLHLKILQFECFPSLWSLFNIALFFHLTSYIQNWINFQCVLYETFHIFEVVTVLITHQDYALKLLKVIMEIVKLPITYRRKKDSYFSRKICILPPLKQSHQI